MKYDQVIGTFSDGGSTKVYSSWKNDASDWNSFRNKKCENIFHLQWHSINLQEVENSSTRE